MDVALSGISDSGVDVRSTLAGGEAKVLSSGSDPKAESMELLELMGQSGVLDSAAIGQILGKVRDTIDRI